MPITHPRPKAPQPLPACSDHQSRPESTGIHLKASAPWAALKLSGSWWRDEDLISAQVADFVAGINSIAQLSIPYARLPRRWGAHAQHFPRWADVAGQTLQSLLDRPKLGESAIRALIDVAREAVSATCQRADYETVTVAEAVAALLDRLDDFDRGILSGRWWTWRPTPLHTLSSQLGRSQAGISRNAPRARRRFEELAADPAHAAVLRHAATLRQRLGPYTPLAAVEDEIRKLDLAPDSVTAHLLLDLAGPYTLDSARWVQNTAVEGKVRATEAVDAVFAEQPAPAPQLLISALTGLGMTTEVAEEYLQTHERLRHVGDVCVRWRGDTAANAVEDILHALGSPATAQAIHAALDADTVKLSTVKYALSNDPRFVRTSRSMWGLDSWGRVQYRGIAWAIGERIDAHGGSVDVDTLTDELLRRYPDISEQSVDAYLSTLAFVVRDGVARRRRRGDRWPTIPPLSTAPGAFRNGDNEVRLTFAVDADLLRGSGQHVHRSIAAAAGVRPGHHRTFTGPTGSLRLQWDLASTRGPDIGSLRALAAAVDAGAGDYLVVVLHPRRARLAAPERVRPTDSPQAQLDILLGHHVDDPLASFADALDCSTDNVATVLRARGDQYWGSLFR